MKVFIAKLKKAELRLLVNMVLGALDVPLVSSSTPKEIFKELSDLPGLDNPYGMLETTPMEESFMFFSRDVNGVSLEVVPYQGGFLATLIDTPGEEADEVLGAVTLLEFDWLVVSDTTEERAVHASEVSRLEDTLQMVRDELAVARKELRALRAAKGKKQPAKKR